MTELTKLRITDKRMLAPYLEAWKGMEWSIDLQDHFGGRIIGSYNPGLALIEAIHRLNPVFELSAQERKEITQLERADPQRAQQRLNEVVSAKATVFYEALVRHFSSELIPSIKDAIGDLVAKVVDVMIMEFDGYLSNREAGNKK
jgi:hypothetical protein